MIRGVRGATTVTADSNEEVLLETSRLVQEMAKANDVQPEDIASVIISTTTDITSAFPARAVRSLEGWTYVPVMCTHEMDVPNSLEKCVRLLMHINTEKNQQDIEHIYLNNAVTLRPDLVK
ncbi:chorismate mutase [Psychrobacillus lasiicapitis]|uniref:chorismate mutase n=1 Tax=Psychrobacillus lasiicapitis TaxID=1636719 RepID=A0A544THN0_9BACI|nr:chorismate mutase [Psychrobacillus lasiicapitis]TQR16967.1 chorismate mutase [Psychrobacillus lasiicapitis]GGA25672.1 chorismate mutase AroH [Psychrobacillus lasiicapitis]